MAKKDDQPTANEFLRSLSEGLKRAAITPNIYGYIPHDKQLPFHTAVEKDRLYIGGNRSGKTTGGIAEDIYWLTGKHPYRKIPPPPIRGRIVGVDFTSGIEKILRPELARWMPLSELKGGSWETAYSKELRTLTLENGSFVEFMSYDQDLDKFAGTSRHFVHFDEEPPQDIFVENKTRLLDTGGSWWITMTPVEGMTWVYDDVYMKGKNEPAANIKVIEVDMRENPHLNPGEVEAYLAGLSKEDRLSRGKGKFVQIGGRVFKSFDTDIHVIDPMVPPKDWEWYASVDHGYNNPTAWLWHAVSPDGNVITFAEHYEAEKTVDYHAAVVHTRNAALGRIPDHYVGDPALSQRQGVTGVSILDTYAQLGIPVIPGNNDVLSGINKINEYLKVTSEGKPRWYVTRNCTNLIREMQRLRWKTWASKRIANQNNVHDQIHKKDDHAPDSARYFFTFLPNLSGVYPESQKQVGPPPISFGTPVESMERIDHNLDPGNYEENSETRWSKEYVDESIGGIW